MDNNRLQLQNKNSHVARLMQSVLAKVNLYEREKRRGQLTLKEIEDLPESVQTYKPIGSFYNSSNNLGKMFLLVPKKDLVAETKQIVSKYDTDLSQLAVLQQ